MTSPILKLTNANRNFTVGNQSVAVLKNINLEIYSGTMVSIVGASGSGKSTLLNILGCLDRPSSGEYIVDGRDINTLTADQLAKLRCEYFGFVFQKYHLLSNLTALENVEIPAIYAGTSKSERHVNSIALLNTFGLADRIDHRPNQLSGGQQQRVSIARALLNGATIILADEPTGALDTENGQEMMRILHDLHDQGHTVIIVTHDMEVAFNAERIIEIRDGMIVGDNPNFLNQALLSRVKNTSTSLRVKKNSLDQAGYLHIAETFKMARLALGTQRLRTVLTMLGIIIGIASVVSIMAIGEGQQRHVKEIIGPFTANKIEIRRGSSWGDSQAASVHSLIPGDVNLLQAQQYVGSVTPLTQISMNVRYDTISFSALVTGVGESYFDVSGITISEGRAFRTEDVKNQSQVVVIDQDASRKLFGSSKDAVGQVVLIGSVPCTVIGVASEKSRDLFAASGGNFLIPYTTAGVRIFGYQHFDSIMVRVREGQNSHLAEQDIDKLLSYKHRMKDFFTTNKESLTKAYEETTKSISLALSLVASITLLVGGIGVMNIMLVSVTERTREIGIRMAVGARQSDIMMQFLVEAVMICLIGGVLGVLISYVAGYVFSIFVAEWKMVFTPLSVVLAFIFSMIIGITFGYLPARRASNLSPYDALSQD